MVKCTLLLVTLLFSINVFSASIANLNVILLNKTNQKTAQAVPPQSMFYGGRDILIPKTATGMKNSTHIAVS